MLPSTPLLSQDLLLVLYQRTQADPSQPNPLSQLLKMNMQLNFLRRFLPYNQSDLNPEANQAQLLNLLTLLNQSKSPEIPDLQSPHHLNIVKPNKILQEPQTKSNERGIESLRSMSFIEQGVSHLNTTSRCLSKSISRLGNLQEKTRGLTKFEEDEEKKVEGISSKSKKIKKMNQCGHPERGHYAKNMCNQCYHKHGRTKKPWRCNHEKLYAHGLCQNCYINAYNQKRNQKLKNEHQNSGQSSELHEGEMDLIMSTLTTDEPLILEDKAAFETLEKNEKPKGENEQN